MEKTCIEYIDYGFSLYTITHKVFQVFIPKFEHENCQHESCDKHENNNKHEIVQTIGIGVHDVSVLPTQLYTRLYDCKFDIFPTEIDRDANGNMSNPIDKFIIFENIQPYQNKF
jgi:hypothetical protein